MAVQDVAQRRQWLNEGRKPREMRAMRPDWSLETKLKQLRRGAPDKSRPLKRRRTSEVLAENETAVNEAPRQTLSVLRWHNSLDMLHRRGRARQRRVLHSDAGRRVLATLHGAPWHRHVDLVVAGRQRSVTHHPAHQTVFKGARNPAPDVATMFV